MKKKVWIIAFVVIALCLAVGAALILRGPSGAEKPKPIENNNDLFPHTAKDLYQYTEDHDYDNDGLNDYEEHNTYKTDPFRVDTDKDRILDGRELERGTDPLNPDTDGDGILDGVEIKAGTDPLKKDADTKVERVFDLGEGDASYKLQGDANIYETVVETFNGTGISNTPGIASTVYWIYSKSNYTGELSFEVPNSDEELSIYKLENTLEFTKIDTQVEKLDKKTRLTANVGNGKYLVGLCSFLDNYKETKRDIDVFLLIDDSGSMYNEMMDGAGNDPEYKRIDMCKNLLENAPENMRFGLATFTATYRGKSGLTDKKDAIMAELDKIKNTPYADKEGQFDGTYIATSLWNALDNFSKEDRRRKLLVVLTDGETTEGTSIWNLFDDIKSVSDVIQKAGERNVTIITVALGNEVDTKYLTDIEASTGGSYIYANNADAMEDLYAAILGATNYDFIDTDEDGEADGVMVADSGFRPEVNGFHFRNPVIKTEEFSSFGLCYGISTFSSLYYRNKLKTSMDDMEITDWNKLALRYLVKVLTVDAGPYKIDGYNLQDLAIAGLSVNEDREIDYSNGLRDWHSEVMTQYGEYFDWDFDSDYFDGDKHYTKKARDVLNNTELMVPMEHGEGRVGYPGINLSADPAELSNDSLKAQALLRIILRYHMSQLQDDTREDYTYNFYKNYETVKELVASGNPLVICTSDHAMNICRIRQDIETPTLYFIDLYDSNHPDRGTVMTAEIVEDDDYQRHVEYTYLDEAMAEISIIDPHV